MKIQDIIRNKGNAVVSVAPTDSVETLLAVLAEHNIGAAVVSTDGTHIIGIVSERDIVRALAETGAATLTRPVSDIMSVDVHAVDLDAGIEETAHIMTYERIRHVPVIIDGNLQGIVSIGDVVKLRIDQLTDERNHLLGYLHT